MTAAPPTPGFEALLPPEMAKRAEEIGVKKASTDAVTLLVLAVLAGAFIALGGVFATVALSGAGVASWGATRELQVWMGEHPAADLSVAALARRAAMSVRDFARVFTHEVGMTPARFVERARVEAARRRLEESSIGIEAVATQCGFRSAEIMRRAFLRTVRVNPAEYRHRFRIA